MSTHFLHAHLARSASGRSRTPKRHQDATPSCTAGGASVDALYAATELYATLCTWPRLRDLSLRSALAFGVGRRTWQRPLHCELELVVSYMDFGKQL